MSEEANKFRIYREWVSYDDVHHSERVCDCEDLGWAILMRLHLNENSTGGDTYEIRNWTTHGSGNPADREARVHSPLSRNKGSADPLMGQMAKEETTMKMHKVNITEDGKSFDDRDGECLFRLEFSSEDGTFAGVEYANNLDCIPAFQRNYGAVHFRVETPEMYEERRLSSEKSDYGKVRYLTRKLSMILSDACIAFDTGKRPNLEASLSEMGKVLDRELSS